MVRRVLPVPLAPPVLRAFPRPVYCAYFLPFFVLIS
jgi:hypothetical protein